MSRRGWVLFAAMSVVWGVPYLLLRVAGRECAPFVVAATRTGAAALVLLPLAARRGQLRGLAARWPVVLGFALVEVTVPFTFIAYAERHLTSSLSGLLVAATPLFVALLALRFDASERVDGRRLTGLGVGLAGVVLLLGLDVGHSGVQLLAAAAILTSALCYAYGALLIKRTVAQGVPSQGLIAAGLAVSTLLLAGPAAATAPSHWPSARVIACLLALGLVCTALAFVLYFRLLAVAGASRGTVITYVNPAVATVLGVAVLGEPLTVTMGAGFLLVMAGSWLSTRGSPPAAEARRLRQGTAASVGPTV